MSSPPSVSPQTKDSFLDIEGEEISPPDDRLSDTDCTQNEELMEPGFEEIISDEEMPEYTEFDDYVDSEWEEYWAPKFTKRFNPYDDSFEIKPLQVFFFTSNDYFFGLSTMDQCITV